MSLDDNQKHALRQSFARRPRAEIKRVFATVRAHSDRTLLAALAPARKRARPSRSLAGDPLLRDLREIMAPILGPAAEKADLLIEQMARTHRRKLGVSAAGLADAARRLRAHFSDAQIRAAAAAVVARLRKLHDMRETVT